MVVAEEGRQGGAGSNKGAVGIESCDGEKAGGAGDLCSIVLAHKTPFADYAKFKAWNPSYVSYADTSIEVKSYFAAQIVGDAGLNAQV